MKPKDLKMPYIWAKRCVVLQDGVLYIPELIGNYRDFEFPLWESPSIFGNRNPVNIEYCSGNGHWIVAKAIENPHENWVAVEKNFDRVRRIWSKAKNQSITNLFIVYGEGVRFTSLYVPKETISKVFVNFPDPWPKRRHWKNRIIAFPFLNEMTRILKDQSEMFLVTDDPEYSDAIVDELRAFPHFKSKFGESRYSEEMEGYGSSNFEDLWRSQGKAIRYHQFLFERSLNG